MRHPATILLKPFLFEPRIMRYNLGNSDHNLTQPSYNNRYYQNSFTYKASHLWNQLPSYIERSTELSEYRKHLRASFCKYRESGDSFKIFNFFIFFPKALEFFQNRGRFENRHFGLPPPLKIDKNDAFSFRSCW